MRRSRRLGQLPDSGQLSAWSTCAQAQRDTRERRRSTVKNPSCPIANRRLRKLPAVNRENRPRRGRQRVFGRASCPIRKAKIGQPTDNQESTGAAAPSASAGELSGARASACQVVRRPGFGQPAGNWAGADSPMIPAAAAGGGAGSASHFTHARPSQVDRYGQSMRSSQSVSRVFPARHQLTPAGSTVASDSSPNRA